MAAIKFPDWASSLFTPMKYKVYYGGRGAGRSWTIARWIILEMTQRRHRVLCTRELQNSIRDSVHKLLADQIDKMGLSHLFEVGESFIRCPSTKSEVIFKGLKHNINEIKSLEGITITWIEEGQSASNKSFDVLLPTIFRTDNSCLIISFNPENEDDPVYQRFVKLPPPDAVVQKISYRDNPWFPEDLEALRLYDRTHNLRNYNHIWEGDFKEVADGQIYGAEMAQATKEGRITSVPYNPSFPVVTAWDLGFGDSTAIWFAQVVGREPRIIDYYENSMKGLDHYVRYVKDKPYRYGQHVLPHDAGHASIRTGTTIAQQLEDMGLGRRETEFTVLPVDSIETGIQLVRQLLPQVVFDSGRCEEGIRYLKRYHYQYDEDRKTFKNKPNHDYTSHCADAMRYLATHLANDRPVAKLNEPGYSARYMVAR